MKNLLEFLHKITNTQKLTVVSFLILFSLFYWFQIRPSQIKKNCYTSALNASASQMKYVIQKSYQMQQKLYDDDYRSCLQAAGL